jgi:hypothetical protein
MPRILDNPGPHEFVPGAATKASLGALSCPFGRRDVVAQADHGPGSRHAVRPIETQDAGPDGRSSDACAKDRHGRAHPRFLTTDYWNPPTSANQRARQRILAVIVAFVLAAVLAQAGW